VISVRRLVPVVFPVSGSTPGSKVLYSTTLVALGAERILRSASP
jgi:hypothetical protein